MAFSKRVGNFFLVIAIFLVFMFVYTDSVHAPHYSYLVFGILSGLTGLLLRLTAPAPPPPPPSQRFRLLKQDKKPKRDRNSKPPES